MTEITCYRSNIPESETPVLYDHRSYQLSENGRRTLRRTYPSSGGYYTKMGAVNNEGAGVGIVLVSPEGHRLLNAIHFNFQLSNNDAEYETLIGGLRLALEMKVKKLIIKVDSMLVVENIKGGYQANGPKTDIYLRCVQGLLDQFEEVQVNKVLKEFNGDADALAKLASQKDAALLGVKYYFNMIIVDVILVTRQIWSLYFG